MARELRGNGMTGGGKWQGRADDRRRPRSLLRKILRRTFFVLLLPLALLIAAFLNFADTVASLQPPEVIEARVEGRPLGIVGRLTAVTRTWLTQEGAETKITYAVDANLAGKLGSIGQPVLKSKAKDMERKFAERLRAAFHPESQATLGSGPAP